MAADTRFKTPLVAPAAFISMPAFVVIKMSLPAVPADLISKADPLVFVLSRVTAPVPLEPNLAVPEPAACTVNAAVAEMFVVGYVN